MNRRRDLLLTIIGVLFLVVGIAATFDEPGIGGPAIVLGVGMLVMPIAGRLVRGRPRLEGGAVVIDASQAKVWGGRIVLTIAGVAGAVYFVVARSADRWIGLLMAVCFAIAMFEHFRQRAGRAQIVIDADGLRWQDRQLGWEELAAARISDFQEAKYLEPGNVPLEAFPVHPKQLANALRDWARNPRLRAELGTAAALARLDLAPQARQPVKLDAHEVREHR